MSRTPLLPRKRRRVDVNDGAQPQPKANTVEIDEGQEVDAIQTEQALRWNLEQDYERRPRKKKEAQDSLRLPIKTLEGRVEKAPVVNRTEFPVPNGLPLSSLKTQDHAVNEPEDDTSGVNGDAEAAPLLTNTQQLLKAKEELAKLASTLNEDPEENIGLLHTLAQITTSPNSTVKKLGLATQLTVYKDIIPGYRIRPLADSELKEKISKEVRKLRNFEQSILGGYKKYVDQLGSLAKVVADEQGAVDDGVSVVAVSCAAGMLNAAPNFNFRSELLHILVDKLSGKSTEPTFRVSCRALEELFKNDDEGHASLEAVVLLAKMIKGKHYRVAENVINSFLQLRLLSELHKRGSDKSVDKTSDTMSDRTTKLKRTREFRTKSQRKLMRERQKIDKEMEEADATVSHEQRDQLQAETLKIVFGIYLRILKARTSHLTGSVLEGLVKYAHLINQDFFADLLETLKDLLRTYETPEDSDTEIAAGEDQTVDDSSVELPHDREILLCIVTAFSLLQGQDVASATGSLSLDLSHFVSELYQALYGLSLRVDIELSGSSTKEIRSDLPDLSGHIHSTKVNTNTTIVLLLRALKTVLLPANARSASPVRLAAFVKKILASSLHLPEKSCIALNSLLLQVAKTQQKRLFPLWHTEERQGDGIYDPVNHDIEASNPFAASVWEGELLRYHYVPAVRQNLHLVEGAISAE